jgi:hypothetical protein
VAIRFGRFQQVLQQINEMRDLSELNINVGGKRVERAVPSDEQVREFQEHFDITLPSEYLRLLRYSNGGHPELNSIQPAGRPEATRWAIDKFYYLSSDRNSDETLWGAMDVWRAILGKNALPFAEDGGGNQFFLDLRTSPAPVKVCVHDEGFSTIEVAPSFDVFIDMLSADPDMI